MDEGINEFYQQQYEDDKYGTNSDMFVNKGRFLQDRVPPNFNEVQIAALEKIKKTSRSTQRRLPTQKPTMV
jgi:hypothetical protein